MSSEKYLRKHYREFGLEVDDMLEYTKWENTAKRYSEIQKPLDQRIPYISHAIWVVNPKKPRELRDKIESAIVEPYLASYKVLDSLGVKWTHYVWTNYLDQNLIPETVQLFNSMGVQVRDIKEFESSTPEVLALYDEEAR